MTMKMDEYNSLMSIDKCELIEIPPHVKALIVFLTGEHAECLTGYGQETIAYGLPSYLGYSIAFESKYSPDLISSFCDEVTLLAEKKFFIPSRVPRFEVDGPALLGVALGLYTIKCEDKLYYWFLELLNCSYEALEGNIFEQSLVDAARQVLNKRDSITTESEIVSVAISHRLGLGIDSSLRNSAWTKVFEDSLGDLQIRSFKIAVFDHCVSCLASISIDGAGYEDLKLLLENVASTSISKWTYEHKPRVRHGFARKWNIDHEYHVQNYLHTILKPVFPDLVEEETLPKIGPKSPRADLCIPSLLTIVEVKFWKNTGQRACADLLEELAADSALYRGHRSQYKRIIAYIWDNCRQTERYSVLRDGLRELAIDDVIIHTRPSHMEDKD